MFFKLKWNEFYKYNWEKLQIDLIHFNCNSKVTTEQQKQALAKIKIYLLILNKKGGHKSIAYQRYKILIKLPDNLKDRIYLRRLRVEQNDILFKI